MESLWAPWRMDYIKGAAPDECIFCLRDRGDEDLRRLVLLRTQHCFVIMNRYPYTNGHLMVAPFRHSADPGSLSEAEVLDLHRLICLSREVLCDCARPDGFNIGLNLGKVAGAGVAEHLHCHIVPRWSGDTNFMPVLADVRVVPEHLEATYAQLRAGFQRLQEGKG